ncbi:MAG: hypothetical protein B7Z76_02515 [Acidiphilium sp. 20-67-58]|nr:MAG: hypothetical protein B7Z76_02515 [Acidiphilium sp. 20-67-58]
MLLAAPITTPCPPIVGPTQIPQDVMYASETAFCSTLFAPAFWLLVPIPALSLNDRLDTAEAMKCHCPAILTPPSFEKLWIERALF